MVALVPQGLVLLLSMAQAVAVIRLGHKQVLVQQLQAVETLARVTVLASDKTGTLTTGEVSLEKIEPLTAGGNGADLEAALAALAAADEYPNATMKAIQRAFPTSPGWSTTDRIPFDSTHKYSAVAFDGHGAWYVGAPEILLPADHPRAAAGAAAGLRGPAGAAPRQRGAPCRPPAPCPRPQRRRAGAVQRRHPARRRRDHRVLPPGERAAEGDLGRQPGHRVGHRAALPRPRRRALHRRPPAADRSGRAGRGRRGERRLRPGHARGQAGAAARAAGPGGGGGHDRRRRERHPRPEGRRPRHRHGRRHAGGEVGVGAGAARQPVLHPAERRGRGPPGDRQHRAGRPAVRDQERLGRGAGRSSPGSSRTRYPLRPRHLTVVDALTIGIPGFVLSFQPSHDPVRPGFIPRVLRFSIPAGVIMGLATMFVYELGKDWLDGRRGDGPERRHAHAGGARAVGALRAGPAARPHPRRAHRGARRHGGRRLHHPLRGRLLPARGAAGRLPHLDRRHRGRAAPC